MTRRLAIAAVAATLVCCRPARTYLAGAPAARSPLADTLGPVPGFVVVPAVDDRPRAEHAGGSPELGYIMASTGGAMSRTSGAAVLGGDANLGWRQRAFGELPSSAATSVAADLGASLEGATGRPVMFVAGDLDEAAGGARDGTVVVQVVIDHLTRIAPANRDFSQTKSQQGDYEVTTTITSSESFGPFWTFSFRIRLGLVKDGHVVRRLVRYAAAAALDPSAYATAINAAVDQVVLAVAAEWANPTPAEDEALDDGVAPGI